MFTVSETKHEVSWQNKLKLWKVSLKDKPGELDCIYVPRLKVMSMDGVKYYRTDGTYISKA